MGLIFLFLVACSSVKKTERALNEGNYDTAIDRAIKELRTGKDKKSNQSFVYLLEEAFAKAVERDMNDLSYYKKDPNPETFQSIYNTYERLDRRQESIKPLMPLRLLSENRNARFDFKNYTQDLIKAKEQLSNHLYQKAKAIASVNAKPAFREAFETLEYLQRINPNYRDAAQLMNEYYAKGVQYVHLYITNESEIAIPKRLESDLTQISTYGLNDKWVVYHNQRRDELFYDYDLKLAFRAINVSPELVQEKQFVKEKDVVEGWEYLEKNGKIV
ncbi:MAG: hypothetical protein RQ756_10130, partial [Flavobacteriaceae bacterium]|nr:hypothetical protein [Flavobacteriaceae bacterium]